MGFQSGLFPESNLMLTQFNTDSQYALLRILSSVLESMDELCKILLVYILKIVKQMVPYKNGTEETKNTETTQKRNSVINRVSSKRKLIATPPGKLNNCIWASLLQLSA